MLVRVLFLLCFVFPVFQDRILYCSLGWPKTQGYFSCLSLPNARIRHYALCLECSRVLSWVFQTPVNSSSVVIPESGQVKTRMARVDIFRTKSIFLFYLFLCVLSPLSVCLCLHAKARGQLSSLPFRHSLSF